MLVTACSEQEVRLGMSLPVPVRGCPAANNTWGQHMPAHHWGNNPHSPLAIGHTNFPPAATSPLRITHRPNQLDFA